MDKENKKTIKNKEIIENNNEVKKDENINNESQEKRCKKCNNILSSNDEFCFICGAKQEDD